MRFVSAGQLQIVTVAGLSLAAVVAMPLSRAQAQVTVTNGSFEANTTSFTNAPGYVSTGGNPTITGWLSNNTRSGLNNNNGTGNAFADNGTKPDGPTVAFLQVADQGSTSLTQSLTGFVTGQQYSVSFYLNRRQAFDTPGLTLTVALGGTTLYSSAVPQSAGTNPYALVTTSIYTATSTAAQNLVFTASNPNSGDSTALIDRVVVNNLSAAPEPGSLALLIPAGLGVAGLVIRRRK